MISLAIGGCKGRMGQRIIELAADDERFEVVAGFDRDLWPAPTSFDVLIDFSLPDGTLRFAELCTEQGAALVSGTTGLSTEQLATLQKHAAAIAMLRADNFSLGINLLLELLPDVAQRLGPAFEAEIVETHHTQKVDAPSGTALALLDVLLAATGRNCDDHVVLGRAGRTGAKPKAQIGVHAVRSGDVVGRHEIIFGGSGESITLTHQAYSRDTFAAGALAAAAWICGRPAGSYSMRNVVASQLERL